MEPSERDGVQRFGVVDLGSNTARLVVYRYAKDHWYRLEDSIREPIRLAEGMSQGRELLPSARGRARDALVLFSDFAGATGLKDVTVIATSAVRDASNRDVFFAEIEDVPLEISVLSGEGEAEYGVRAVANGTAVDDAWVVDLGGGSMQISEMKARQMAGGTAFPLGALRLTERYLDGAVDSPKHSQIVSLERGVEAELAPALRQIRESDAPFVAMGGTVRALAGLAQDLHNHPMDLRHGYQLSLENLEAVVAELVSQPLAARRKISGLNPDRADLIVAGGLAFRTLLRASGRRFLTISGFGVREGVLFKRMLKAPHLVPDVKRFGVENLFQQYVQPLAHTEKVVELSLSLFDQLAPVHQLGSESRDVLEAAARLHDIGMTIDYNRHHRHGQMLLQAAALPGFSHREQALIALLVRYHRNGDPSPQQFGSILSAVDRRALPVLVICLRLAEQFERSRTGRVRRLEVAVQDDVIDVGLVCGAAPNIELWEAGKHGALFRRAFGRDLRLLWAGDTGSS